MLDRAEYLTQRNHHQLQHTHHRQTRQTVETEKTTYLQRNPGFVCSVIISTRAQEQTNVSVYWVVLVSSLLPAALMQSIFYIWLSAIQTVDWILCLEVLRVSLTVVLHSIMRCLTLTSHSMHKSMRKTGYYFKRGDVSHLLCSMKSKE